MPDLQRPSPRPRALLALALAALGALTACGGGGDDAVQQHQQPQGAPLWDAIDWDQDVWA